MGGFGGDSVHDIFEDIFGDMMGGGRSRSRGGRVQGSDLQYNLEISLDDAYRGKTVKLEIPRSVHCVSCSGSGAAKGSDPVNCASCGGVGQVRSSSGFFSIQRTCPHCGGRGKVIKDPCNSCRGSGNVQETNSLSVDIPAGIDEGNKLRLSGKGEAGSQGGPSGDLYIFVTISGHPLFERRGADIHCSVPISFADASLGGEFEIMGIDSSKQRVKVPVGTQNGMQFRLQGKGMPIARSRRFGDMYVKVYIETPQDLSKAQKKLLEEFRQSQHSGNNPESTGFFSQMNQYFDKKRK